jgi:hypothetical protein
MIERIEGERTLRLWRRGLACVLLFDAISYVARTVPDAREHAAWASAAGWIGAMAGSWAVVGAVGVAAVASIVAFARARDPLLPGLFALALARAQHELLSATLGVFQQNYYQSGSALGGWVAGRAFVRAWNRLDETPIGERDAERIAAYGAMGMLAATWVNAGVSKLRETGLAWATSDGLRLMLLAHWRPGHAIWREPIFLYVVGHPRFAVALQVATLVVELGAIFLLARGRLRVATGAAVVALHAGIWLTSGIQFVEAAALAAVFGFPWVGGAGDDEAPGRASYARRSVAVATVEVALVLGALALSTLPARDQPTARGPAADTR